MSLSGHYIPATLNPAMAPAAPTPEELYAALRNLYPGLSEEHVARELGLTSVKQLQQLKTSESGEPGTFPRGRLTVELLEAVGWIQRDGEAPLTRAQAHRMRREIRELATTLEEVAKQLP